MAQLPFENFGLFNPKVAGKLEYGFGLPFNQSIDAVLREKEQEVQDEDKKERMTPFQEFMVNAYKDAQEEKKYYRSDEYLDKMYQRADDLQARQMARAQKYGKESAMYGFFYEGLPKMITQAAFSKYAFAPEMVKGVQDAYSRINLAGAVKPLGGQSYMSVNPMG